MITVQKMLQHEALRLVFWQLIITLVISMSLLLIEGFTKGISVLSGGSAYLLPNFIFAWGIFSYSGSFSPDRFMLAFLLSEFIKLALSAVLFILIVKFLPINLLFVMIGYVLAIFSFWVVCGWHFSRRVSS